MGLILKLVAVLLGVLALDLGVCLYYERLLAALGTILGLEIGLAIFLNALGFLVVLDLLEDVWTLPGFGWYYRIPASPRPAVSESGIVVRSRRYRAVEMGLRIVAVTVALYLFENLLFPFLPLTTYLEFEALLVFTGVALQVIPMVLWSGGRHNTPPARRK